MAATKTETYYATGRRKSAIARVWLDAGSKGFLVNGRTPEQYLRRSVLNDMVEQPFKITQLTDRFRVRAKVEGGGIAGQAGAITLGIARALVKYDDSLRPTLRKNGFLTRDPREKERKKPGRKGARKSFQFTKR